MFKFITHQGPWKNIFGPGKVIEKSWNFVTESLWEPWTIIYVDLGLIELRRRTRLTEVTENRSNAKVDTFSTKAFLQHHWTELTTLRKSKYFSRFALHFVLLLLFGRQWLGFKPSLGDSESPLLFRYHLHDKVSFNTYLFMIEPFV